MGCQHLYILCGDSKCHEDKQTNRWFLRLSSKSASFGFTYVFIQIFRGSYKNFSILCIKCSWQLMLEKSRTSRSTLFSFDWILELSKRLKKALMPVLVGDWIRQHICIQQELFLEGQAQEGLTKNGCSQLSMMVYLYIVLEGEISALCLYTIDTYASRSHACSLRRPTRSWMHIGKWDWGAFESSKVAHFLIHLQWGRIVRV